MSASGVFCKANGVQYPEPQDRVSDMYRHGLVQGCRLNLVFIRYGKQEDVDPTFTFAAAKLCSCIARLCKALLSFRRLMSSRVWTHSAKLHFIMGRDRRHRKPDAHKLLHARKCH